MSSALITLQSWSPIRAYFQGLH